MHTATKRLQIPAQKILWNRQINSTIQPLVLSCTEALNFIKKLDKAEHQEMKKVKINTRSERCNRYYWKKEKTFVSTTLVAYKDCRKNHAANIGRYAVDGCCEFMPAGDVGSPGAFLCAACNCHRNFHRKIVVGTGIHDTSYSCDCSSMSTAAN